MRRGEVRYLLKTLFEVLSTPCARLGITASRDFSHNGTCGWCRGSGRRRTRGDMWNDAVRYLFRRKGRTWCHVIAAQNKDERATYPRSEVNFRCYRLYGSERRPLRFAGWRLAWTGVLLSTAERVVLIWEKKKMHKRGCVANGTSSPFHAESILEHLDTPHEVQFDILK